MFLVIVNRTGIAFSRTLRIELVKLILNPILAAVDSHRFGKVEVRVAIPAIQRVRDDTVAPTDFRIRDQPLGFVLQGNAPFKFALMQTNYSFA